MIGRRWRCFSFDGFYASDGFISCVFLPMSFSSAKPFMIKGTDEDHVFMIEQLLPINNLNT